MRSYRTSGRRYISELDLECKLYFIVIIALKVSIFIRLDHLLMILDIRLNEDSTWGPEKIKTQALTTCDRTG